MKFFLASVLVAGVCLVPAERASAQGGHTLKAYYSFEDNNLFAHDYSGNTNNIGSYGYYSTPPHITNDVAAGSYAFAEPGDGWLYAPTNNNLVATLAGSFSVSLWLKTSEVAGNDGDGVTLAAGIVSAFNGSSHDVVPMAMTGRKLVFYTGGSTSDTLHSLGNISQTGQYVHIVVTRDQPTGEKKIYINGALDTSDFGSTESLNSSTELDIGYNNSQPIDGEMDDIQIYAGVLSASEVQQLYNNPGTTIGNTTGQSELVANGGFETGDLTSWTLSQDNGGIFVDNGSSLGATPHSGNYVAEFGTTGALGYLSQTLTTTPGGNYLLSFWLDSPDGQTPNEFQVSWNGTVLFDATNLPVTGWTNLQFVVTATGTNTVLQFGGQDDPSYLGLDDVSVVSTQVNSLGAALDATNLTWTAGGDASWFVENAVTHDGLSAAQSGTITDSQTSYLETTVPGDGQVTFYWKVSSEQDFDYLTFYINGVQQNAISGEVDWNQQTYAVSAGDTLRWEYSKDESVSEGADAGWLDQVQYTPPPYPATVNFYLVLEQNTDLSYGSTYYAAFPDLSYVDPAPVTTNSVVSPDGNMHSEVGPGSTSAALEYGEGFNTLDEMLNACTNGQWTLYINKGDPSEKVFHFNVVVSGLTSNFFGAINVISPAVNSANVVTNPAFAWSGPAGFSSVVAETYLYNPDFTATGYTNLAGDATSWPSSPTLPYGTNNLYVGYNYYNAPNVTFTTPVESDLTPLENWSGTDDLVSDVTMWFYVGAPAPLPFQIISSHLTGGGGGGGGNGFQFSFGTLAGRPMTVQTRSNMTVGSWTDVTNFVGDGSLKQFTFPINTNLPSQFFRVRMQ